MIPAEPYMAKKRHHVFARDDTNTSGATSNKRPRSFGSNINGPSPNFHNFANPRISHSVSKDIVSSFIF